MPSNIEENGGYKGRLDNAVPLQLCLKIGGTNMRVKARSNEAMLTLTTATTSLPGSPGHKFPHSKNRQIHATGCCSGQATTFLYSTSRRIACKAKRMSEMIRSTSTTSCFRCARESWLVLPRWRSHLVRIHRYITSSSDCRGSYWQEVESLPICSLYLQVKMGRKREGTTSIPSRSPA